MSSHRKAIPVLLALGAACGQYQSPDLEHGAVTGRIPGAAAGAYAYVLGSPEIFANAEPDGSFNLDNVPAGQPKIVLYDGSAGAEMMQVEVSGAKRSRLEPEKPLQAAGAILVAASPLRGVSPKGLKFTIEGTPLRDVSGESGAARIFPLPAGSFGVIAAQPGFREKRLRYEVSGGASGALEVELEVDDDDDDGAKGCRSCGCEDGLYCADDGRCYACATDADCGPGGTCTASRLCSYPPGDGHLCEACSVASDCVGAGSACVNPSGGTLTGYCSQTCTTSSTCPSGFDCLGGACVAPLGCRAWSVSYGSTCADDVNCEAALHDGKCLERSSSTAGFCGAKIQAGCPSGYSADPSGYCIRPAP
jgi:hypothetical protein